MNPTKIPYLDMTWNPITGCEWVSHGCDNCWAKAMANRFRGKNGYPEKDPFRSTFRKERLQEPWECNEPKRIFVVSMGDLFCKYVHEVWLEKILKVMVDCDWHTYFICTKRPERMKSFIENHAKEWQLLRKHAVLCVSIEDERVMSRARVLAEIDADCRMFSLEPLIGPLDVSGALSKGKVHGVIIGGESGQKGRVMSGKWVSRVIKDAGAAKVPVFFKQWGHYEPARKVVRDGRRAVAVFANQDEIAVSRFKPEGVRNKLFDDWYYRRTQGISWGGYDMLVDGSFRKELPDMLKEGE